MSTYLRNMLLVAAALGAHFCVICDGEEDYAGRSVEDALDAIEAVDEADLYVRVDGVKGYALIVNGLDDDEQIADASGWCDVWMDENNKD